ncbi:PAS domain S-box protein [Sesbania bispinosa]|nr:PAS domain S-box protein [Sesbania bispinosa]
MVNKKPLHLKRDSCLPSARGKMPWTQPRKDAVRKVTEPIRKKKSLVKSRRQSKIYTLRRA